MAVEFPKHLTLRMRRSVEAVSAGDDRQKTRFTVTNRSSAFNANDLLGKLEHLWPSSLRELVSLTMHGSAIRISPRGSLDGAPDMLMTAGVRGVRVCCAANPLGDPLFEVGRSRLPLELRQAGEKLLEVLDRIAPANKELGGEFHQLAKAYIADPGARVSGLPADETPWLKRVPQPIRFGPGLPLYKDLPFHLDGDRLREKPDVDGLVLLARSERKSVIAVQHAKDGYRVLRVARTGGDIRSDPLVDGLNDIRVDRLCCNSANNMFAASADGRRIFEYSLPHSVLGRQKSVRELPVPAGTTEVVQLGSDGLRPYALLRDDKGDLAIFKLGDRGPHLTEMPAGMDPASVRFEEVGRGMGRVLLVHGEVKGLPASFGIGFWTDGLAPIALG